MNDYLLGALASALLVLSVIWAVSERLTRNWLGLYLTFFGLAAVMFYSGVEGSVLRRLAFALLVLAIGFGHFALDRLLTRRGYSPFRLLERLFGRS